MSRRAFRPNKARPSAPRTIGAANDDAPGIANDNDRIQVGGVLLTAEQTRRFRRAEENAASEDHRLKVSGRAALVQLEGEIADAADRQRVAADLVETRALEEARGATIEVSNRPEHRGRIRIASRDGLETLMTAGSLTSNQYAAGLRYRADYEHLDPERGLTPPALDQTRRIGRGGEGWAKRLEEIRTRVEGLERAIQAEDPTFRGAAAVNPVHRVGRRVWALREVAGKGSNLSALSSSGSSQLAYSDALRSALDAASIVYSLE
jgi:hypothetical protein